MDQVKFREVRDKLNSDTTKKWYMSKSGDSWGWGYIESSVYPPEGEDLSGIEYNEVSPDGFQSGSLLGFIYMDHNCPAILGYGKRTEKEKAIMKYLWKVNHGDGRSEIPTKQILKSE